jgi:ADP-glucose pyrophosphorylase
MNHTRNVFSSTRDSIAATNRGAIVLAGGDGTRLRSLTESTATSAIGY